MTLTKEWLRKTIAELEEERDAVPGAVNEDAAMALAAMKLALASLEAEPVVFRSKLKPPSAIGSENWDYTDHRQPDAFELESCVIERLYTAPPAPEFYKIGDATMRHIFTPTGITDVSDMQAVFDQIETVLAGMWQPAPVSVPDEIRLLQSEVTIWKDRWELLRELFREVADALGCDVKDNQAMLDKIEMLQGAETVTTAYKLPEGWVAVPVEPTEDMIVNGFESEPDESFSDEKEWEAYEAMSGCQQAAHRARLCWSAMIASRPKLKHDLT